MRKVWVLRYWWKGLFSSSGNVGLLIGRLWIFASIWGWHFVSWSSSNFLYHRGIVTLKTNWWSQLNDDINMTIVTISCKSMPLPVLDEFSLVSLMADRGWGPDLFYPFISGNFGVFMEFLSLIWLDGPHPYPNCAVYWQVDIGLTIHSNWDQLLVCLICIFYNLLDDAILIFNLPFLITKLTIRKVRSFLSFNLSFLHSWTL